MKAYCRTCEAATEHRFAHEPIQEIVCNQCSSVAITFHENVIVQRVLEQPCNPEHVKKSSGCHLCQSDPCQCGACN